MLEFKVTGMTCQGCVKAVRRAVERVLPNSNPNVDLGTGRLSVEADDDESKTIRQRVIAAVEAAGFDAEVVST